MTNHKGNGEGAGVSAAQSERLVAQAERLIGLMQSVAKESGIRISTVEERVEQRELEAAALVERQKELRRMTVALIVAFVLIVTANAGIVLLGLGVREQAREVENIQEKVTGEVLCPLYQQFINSDTPRARAIAKAAGQDMKVREHAFAVIREGYKTLDCENRSVINK